MKFADYVSLFTLLALLGGGLVSAVITWVVWRKGSAQITGQTLDNLTKLSSSQSLRISAIESEMLAVKEENLSLHKQNKALVELNLALQTSSAEQSVKITRMENRIRDLETQVVSLGGHIIV